MLPKQDSKENLTKSVRNIQECRTKIQRMNLVSQPLLADACFRKKFMTNNLMSTGDLWVKSLKCFQVDIYFVDLNIQHCNVYLKVANWVNLKGSHHKKTIVTIKKLKLIHTYLKPSMLITRVDYLVLGCVLHKFLCVWEGGL